MIESLIVYDLAAVKKKLTLAKIKTWHKGGLINDEQWASIQASYTSGLYSPTIIMRILLFIATYFGLTTFLGLIGLGLEDFGEITLRIMVVIAGIGMLVFTERILIKEKKHFKSGVTEASTYTGMSFLYFSILGFDINEPLVYLSIALIILIVFSIRYLDLLSLICAIGCFLAMLFALLEDIMALLPFIVMLAFALLFIASQSIQKKVDELIWEDHFIIFDTLSLLLIYLGGNYLVVRELSVEMMNLNLSDGEDIPFAFLFYGFTLLIPCAYLIWGIRKKSILFIRVSLLVIALSAFTIKYYYLDLNAEVLATIAGAFLVLVSFALIKYLKVNRDGFTRDQIFQSKWDNADIAAFIASQTLGSYQINEPDASSDSISGQGGEFGGGGASGEY